MLCSRAVLGKSSPVKVIVRNNTDNLQARCTHSSSFLIHYCYYRYFLENKNCDLHPLLQEFEVHVDGSDAYTFSGNQKYARHANTAIPHTRLR